MVCGRGYVWKHIIAAAIVTEYTWFNFSGGNACVGAVRRSVLCVCWPLQPHAERGVIAAVCIRLISTHFTALLPNVGAPNGWSRTERLLFNEIVGLAHTYVVKLLLLLGFFSVILIWIYFFSFYTCFF